MKDYIFQVIDDNHTLISATITILVLAVASLTATGVTLRSVLDSESMVSYLVYQKGYRDATVRATSQTFSEFQRDETLAAVGEIVTILKTSCFLSLLSSIFHFTSSAWTIFKRSSMSRIVWLLAQSLAFIFLLTSIVLPMAYRLKGPLVLNIYYAVLVVDAFLTLSLLLVVYCDSKFIGATAGANTDDIPAPEMVTSQSGSEDAGATTQAEASAVITVPRAPASDNTDEPLPPPPPPPSVLTNTVMSAQPTPPAI